MQIECSIAVTHENSFKSRTSILNQPPHDPIYFDLSHIVMHMQHIYIINISMSSLYSVLHTSDVTLVVSNSAAITIASRIIVPSKDINPTGSHIRFLRYFLNFFFMTTYDPKPQPTLLDRFIGD